MKLPVVKLLYAMISIITLSRFVLEKLSKNQTETVDVFVYFIFSFVFHHAIHCLSVSNTMKDNYYEIT